jgi:hypothetical protein
MGSCYLYCKRMLWFRCCDCARECRVVKVGVDVSLARTASNVTLRSVMGHGTIGKGSRGAGQGSRWAMTWDEARNNSEMVGRRRYRTRINVLRDSRTARLKCISTACGWNPSALLLLRASAATCYRQSALRAAGVNFHPSSISTICLHRATAPPRIHTRTRQTPHTTATMSQAHALSDDQVGSYVAVEELTAPRQLRQCRQTS